MAYHAQSILHKVHMDQASLMDQTCFWDYKEKTISLYFWDKKYIWLVEINKKYIYIIEEKNRKY